jgi:hypothetical protein
VDPHASNRENVSSPGVGLGIMSVFVHELTIHGTQIFHPLLFYVYKRPLAAAEEKMLYAG